MKVFEGAVVIWCDNENRIFNDLKKADNYFTEQKKNKQNPKWQRIWKE